MFYNFAQGKHIMFAASGRSLESLEALTPQGRVFEYLNLK